MLIGGLQKFSLLDYPDHLAAIIFTQGCNFRCRYCYNPMLVWPVKASDKLQYDSSFDEQKKGRPSLKEDDLFIFLESRAGKLEGVVITGGEPTIQPDLPDFIAKIKSLGFLIKLDTNGTRPAMLEKLVHKELIDYIAMDLKAPQKKYKTVTGVDVDFAKIEKSVKIIMTSGLPYEFRTTMASELLDKNDIKVMAETIKGASKWYLQKFKSGVEMISPELKGKIPYSSKAMKEMAAVGRKFVKRCEVR